MKPALTHVRRFLLPNIGKEFPSNDIQASFRSFQPAIHVDIQSSHRLMACVALDIPFTLFFFLVEPRATGPR